MLGSTAVLAGAAVRHGLDVGVSEFEPDATFGGGYHFAAVDGGEVDLVALVGDVVGLTGFLGGCVKGMAHGSIGCRGEGLRRWMDFQLSTQ